MPDLPAPLHEIPPAPSDPDQLRAHTLGLIRSLGTANCLFIEALAAIHARKLARTYGYRSFAAYVVTELDIEAKDAYRAVEVYRHYQPAWPRARMIPWLRLLEAAPLLRAGVTTLGDLVEKLKEPSCTIKAIRVWKKSALPADSPTRDPPDGVQTDLGINPLPIHADIDVTKRWTSKTDDKEWVEIACRLPRRAYEHLLDALGLAKQMLELKREEGDERATLPMEVEAVCAEVASTWIPALADAEAR